MLGVFFLSKLRLPLWWLKVAILKWPIPLADSYLKPRKNASEISWPLTNTFLLAWDVKIFPYRTALAVRRQQQQQRWHRCSVLVGNSTTCVIVCIGFTNSTHRDALWGFPIEIPKSESMSFPIGKPPKFPLVFPKLNSHKYLSPWRKSPNLIVNKYFGVIKESWKMLKIKLQNFYTTDSQLI